MKRELDPDFCSFFSPRAAKVLGGVAGKEEYDRYSLFRVTRELKARCSS